MKREITERIEAHAKVKDLIGIILAIIFIIIVFILIFGWIWYQFYICYPEVSKNVWYCLQHAL